jgi:hypothetical protein
MVFAFVAAATRDNALFSRVRKEWALDWVNRMVLSSSLRYLPHLSTSWANKKCNKAIAVDSTAGLVATHV